jgi:hypothetical protein
MKRLREIPSENIEELFFDICIKSKDGCNIKVGDKLYHVYTDTRNDIIKTEITLDYELTEEEFKKLK